jgi:MYXO-CTERM domain-containing protein
MIDAGADAGLPFAGAAPDIGMFEVGLDACAGLVPGTGGMGGSGNGGGGPGGAGNGGAGNGGSQGGAGGGAGAEGGNGPGEEGGCGCRTAGGGTPSPDGLGALAALAALLVTRRRRLIGR